MVLPAKIFEIRGDFDFPLIVERLKDFREEEPYQTDEGNRGNLVTEVLDLEEKEGIVTGVFSKDFLPNLSE